LDKCTGGNLAIDTGFAAAESRMTSGCGVDTPVPMAIAVRYPALDPIRFYEKGYLTSDFGP